MKTLKITIVLFISIFLVSCSKEFLELAPISNMNGSDFYKSKKDFELAINAAYQTLYNQYGPESGVSFTEQMSDECTMYMVAGNVADRSAFKNYTLRADNTIVKTTWNDGFIALNKIKYHN